MDLRQLEILQAIAETGSFTACGRKLRVSQSAISRQVLILEEELGEPLFLRVGRQVRMTPAAESLVQLGQRVFQDVRDTVGSITDQTGALRGRLRLSGGMTVCLYVFPALLKHLKRVYPELEIRLTVASATLQRMAWYSMVCSSTMDGCMAPASSITTPQTRSGQCKTDGKGISGTEGPGTHALR